MRFSGGEDPLPPPLRPGPASSCLVTAIDPSSTSLGRRSLDGMNQEELAAVRPRLEEFAVEVFAPLARADQRNKGQTYLRGLLLDGRRKSMQPMAERLGVD